MAQDLIRSKRRSTSRALLRRFTGRMVTRVDITIVKP